jgi:ribosomal protein S18 acetylase RimI-like enzyme
MWQVEDRMANDSVTVRRASFQDLDSIVPLFDAYRQFYRKPSDLGLAKTFLAERLTSDESVLLIATGHAEILGFVQMFPSFSSGAAARILILNDLFVVPDARRKGIGTSLLRAAAAYGKTAGANRLTLSTEVTNKGARALYEAEGWAMQTDFCVYNLALS